MDEPKPWIIRLLRELGPKEIVAAILVVSGALSGVNGCVRSQDAVEAVEASETKLEASQDRLIALQAQVKKLKARVNKLERRAGLAREATRTAPKERSPVRRFLGWIWP